MCPIFLSSTVYEKIIVSKAYAVIIRYFVENVRRCNLDKTRTDANIKYRGAPSLLQVENHDNNMT